MPLGERVPGPTRWRTVAGLFAVVVASLATIATSPPQEASLTEDAADAVVFDDASNRVFREIEVELAAPGVTPELKSLRVQVRAFIVHGSDKDTALRILLATPPPGIGADNLGEKLLVGGNNPVSLSSRHSLDHCRAGEACVTKVPVVMELLNEDDGPISVGLGISATVEWDQFEPADGPEGSELTISVKDLGEDATTTSRVVRSSVERIVLDPEQPSARRTMQISFPQGTVEDLEMGYGLLVARLTPKTLDVESNPSSVIGAFRLEEGDNLGRQLHPAGAVEGFGIQGCQPMGGRCEIAKIIDFSGCGRCEEPVEIDWWLELRLPDRDPPTEEIKIEFRSSGSLSHQVQETTSFTDASLTRYSLIARVDTGNPPDSAQLTVRVSAIMGESSGFQASSVLVTHVESGVQQLARAHQPAEFPLSSECANWNPCEVDFEVEITAASGVSSLVWLSRLEASFVDSENILGGAGLEIILEPSS